jgi:hypothetical protein
MIRTAGLIKVMTIIKNRILFIEIS